MIKCLEKNNSFNEKSWFLESISLFEFIKCFFEDAHNKFHILC